MSRASLKATLRKARQQAEKLAEERRYQGMPRHERERILALERATPEERERLAELEALILAEGRTEVDAYQAPDQELLALWEQMYERVDRFAAEGMRWTRCLLFRELIRLDEKGSGCAGCARAFFGQSPFGEMDREDLGNIGQAKQVRMQVLQGNKEAPVADLGEAQRRIAAVLEVYRDPTLELGEAGVKASRIVGWPHE